MHECDVKRRIAGTLDMTDVIQSHSIEEQQIV